MHPKKGSVGEAITVSGERYRTIITKFLWPKLNEMDIDDIHRPYFIPFQHRSALIGKPYIRNRRQNVNVKNGPHFINHKKNNKNG